MSYKADELFSKLIDDASNPALDEGRRATAAQKLVGKFLQSSMSSDDILRLTDWLAAGLDRLKSLNRLPPRPNDFVFTDQVIVHLAELFKLLGERLETVSFIGSTPDDRRQAEALIVQYGLHLKSDEIYEDIRQAQFFDLIDLIKQVANGHDFLLGQIAGQLFNHQQSAYLDVSVYLMSQLYRAIAKRLGKVTRYTPAMP
jgi:hypothetical protein